MACSASRNPDIAACVRCREGGSPLRGPHTDSAPMQILDLRRGSETRTLNHVFDPRLHLPSPTVLESRLSALDSIYISPLESKTPLRTVSTPRSGSERDFRASSPSKCGDRRVFVTFASPTPPRRCISSRNRPKASRMHSPVAVAAARSKSRGWEITVGGECHGVFRVTEARTDPNEHGNLLIWDPYTRPKP